MMCEPTVADITWYNTWACRWMCILLYFSKGDWLGREADCGVEAIDRVSVIRTYINYIDIYIYIMYVVPSIAACLATTQGKKRR